MSAPASPDDYFRAVERAFLEFRGGGLVLSPADWDLVCRWKERGIPLEVVHSGIRATFSGKIRPSPRMPLGECARAVEAAFKAERTRQAGAAVPSPVAAAGSGRRFGPLAGRLREWAPPPAALSDPESAGSLRAAARAAAERLEQLDDEPDGGSAPVEATLRDIEGDLLARLEAALRDAVRDEIEAEARRTLEPYRARMPASTWREALRQARCRRAARVVGLDPIAHPD